MYSAVLMLALTAGSETADFGRRGGCTGYSGMCSGPVVSSCGGMGHGHGGLFNRGCSGGGLFHRGGGCSGGGLFSGMHGHRRGCCGSVMTTCSASCAQAAPGCATSAPAPAPKTMPSESIPVTPKKTKTAVEVPTTDTASVPATVDYVPAQRRGLFSGLFRRN